MIWILTDWDWIQLGETCPPVSSKLLHFHICYPVRWVACWKCRLFSVRNCLDFERWSMMLVMGHGRRSLTRATVTLWPLPGTIHPLSTFTTMAACGMWWVRVHYGGVCRHRGSCMGPAVSPLEHTHISHHRHQLTSNPNREEITCACCQSQHQHSGCIGQP